MNDVIEKRRRKRKKIKNFDFSLFNQQYLRHLHQEKRSLFQNEKITTFN